MDIKTKIDARIKQKIISATEKRRKRNKTLDIRQYIASKTSSRHYNDWIRAYVALHEVSESPINYHYWTAISTITAALSRKCWVNAGDLTIYPNFYIIYVAPPGVAQKSTAMGGGLKLLQQLEDFNLGHATSSWQALVSHMEDHPKHADILQSNGDIITTTYHPMHVTISELGTYFTSQDSDKINFLVDMWDNASAYTRNTLHTGSIVIPKPSLSLIGGCTPGWLQQPNNKYITAGGLASRIIFIYEDKKDNINAYPTSPGGDKARQALFEDLERIEHLNGEFTLSAEAHEHLELFYHMTNLIREEGTTSEHHESFLSRAHAHSFKLAMAACAARGDDKEISYDDAVFAEYFTMQAYDNINPVQNLLMTSEGALLRDKVTKLLLTSAHEYTAKTSLVSHLEDIMQTEQAYAAISAAERTGKIEKRQVGSEIMYKAIGWTAPTSIRD